MDGEKGQNDVRISPKKAGAWNKWGADEEQNLNDADYCFDDLVINITEFDVIRLDDNTWSNPFEHTNRTEYGYTDIYVRYEGDSEFSFYKNVQITQPDTTVSLPSDAVGFKVVHKTNFTATNLSITTKLKLKPTARLTDIVINDIVKERNTVIKNKARFSETMTGVENAFQVDTEHYTVASRDAFESSYVLGVTDSYIYAKKSLGTLPAEGGTIEVDSETGTVTVPAVITGWGYNNSGYKKRMRKCIFRDLLPKDFSVDKSSIFVVPIKENYTLVDKEGQPRYPSSVITGNKYQANYDAANRANELLPSGRYSVSFENNANNSGRTMMNVTVTIPDNIIATGISVYFKMKTTQASIAAITTTPINYVSFKDLTENQSVPVDRSDKINIIDSKLVDCYSSYDDVFTAYASATTTLDKPPISTTAISSIVTADGSPLSKHENVGLNMNYSYDISYSNDLNTQTRDLVFYDVLEKKFDGTVSQWEGILRSVDVSAIATLTNANDENATCNPVVHYAVSSVEEGSTQIPKTKDEFTEEDFALTLPNGESNPIWSTTPPADLSKVTAIAVDCSKDTKGNPFVLDKSQYIGFNINMKSPLGGENGSITYNDATITGKYVNVQGAALLEMVTSNDVTLHYPEPEFTKTAVPAAGESEETANKVVMGSTLNYYLTVTNSDEVIPMYNVVLEDEINVDKVELLTNKIQVKVGDEDPIDIGLCPLATKTKATDKVVDGVNKKVFTTTITSVEPNQTIQVIVPVMVKATEGTIITNAASITKVNDLPEFTPVVTDTTYHVASSVVVKVKKLNERGEVLPHAKLQIQDDQNQPIRG